MAEYEITLNEEQLMLIARCLESAIDIRLGKAAYRSYPYRDIIWNKELDPEEHERVSYMFSQIKRTLFPDLHPDANNGIGTDEETDHLYEMYKALTHERQKRIHQEDENASYNVHSNPPLDLTDKPKIVVKRLTKEILRDRTIDNLLDGDN